MLVVLVEVGHQTNLVSLDVIHLVILLKEWPSQNPLYVIIHLVDREIADRRGISLRVC